jgi:hypothetical protein
MLILGGYLDLLEEDRRQGMEEAKYEEVRAELERIGKKAQAALTESSPEPAVAEVRLTRR